MKHILITNDDGIQASGIIRLAKAAGALGKVIVIAPEAERSAQAHRITVHEPVDLIPHAFPVPGVTAWTCSGSPSDCVRIGLAYLLPDRPDLVLSGINYGSNVASDIQYSATVAAALEAAHDGIPAIAVSEAYKGDPSIADQYLPDLLPDLIAACPGRDAILNLNFPEGVCRGILTNRTVSAGSLHRAAYRRTENLPDGGMRLFLDSYPDSHSEEGSDLRAVLDHFISIGIVRNVG